MPGPDGRLGARQGAPAAAGARSVTDPGLLAQMLARENTQRTFSGTIDSLPQVGAGLRDAALPGAAGLTLWPVGRRP